MSASLLSKEARGRHQTHHSLQMIHRDIADVGDFFKGDLSIQRDAGQHLELA